MIEYIILHRKFLLVSFQTVIFHTAAVARSLSIRSVILRACIRSAPAALILLISTGKTSGNLRKISGNLRKIFGLFRRWRKITEIRLFFCSLLTGNIFRSMDSLFLRHPIICTEFNVRSFHSAWLGSNSRFTSSRCLMILSVTTLPALPLGLLFNTFYSQWQTRPLINNGNAIPFTRLHGVPK